MRVSIVEDHSTCIAIPLTPTVPPIRRASCVSLVIFSKDSNLNSKFTVALIFYIRKDHIVLLPEMQPEFSAHEKHVLTEQRRFCVSELIIIFENSHHTQPAAKSYHRFASHRLRNNTIRSDWVGSEILTAVSVKISHWFLGFVLRRRLRGAKHLTKITCIIELESELALASLG